MRRSPWLVQVPQRSPAHRLTPTPLDTVSHRICLYDPRYMSRNVPSMQTFSAPNFACTSFYVRLAISPDGRYLASGSGAHGYKTHIWDLNTFSARNMFGETNKASVALKGHTAEVGGLDWSSKSVSGPYENPEASSFSLVGPLVDSRTLSPAGNQWRRLPCAPLAV